MLATIILDSFSTGEAKEIAQALDTICAPGDNYGFASACIYAFWSLPERDVLYIGLARDVVKRFRQHTGLLSCEPACCKREKVDHYFQGHARLGYSIIVQSALDQPASEEDRAELAELQDDAFTVQVTDFIEGEDNIVVAEGFLLELHRQLGDRLPPWNEQHGSKRGHHQRGLFPGKDKIDMAVEIVRTGKSPSQIESEWTKRGPSYDLLLNLTGYELSDLNAKSTLRQIASDPTVEGHEEFLHGVRMYMVARGASFKDGLEFQLNHNPYARTRVEAMRADGYMRRTPLIPCSASGGRQAPLATDL
jgi:hypothetical protein